MFSCKVQTRMHAHCGIDKSITRRNIGPRSNFQVTCNKSLLFIVQHVAIVPFVLVGRGFQIYYYEQNAPNF